MKAEKNQKRFEELEQIKREQADKIAQLEKQLEKKSGIVDPPPQ